MKDTHTPAADLTNEYYSEAFFQASFPANHNPLIGVLCQDTLANARNSLYALRQLTETESQVMTPQASLGLHCLMTCVIDALHFELECR